MNKFAALERKLRAFAEQDDIDAASMRSIGRDVFNNRRYGGGMSQLMYIQDEVCYAKTDERAISMVRKYIEYYTKSILDDQEKFQWVKDKFPERFGIIERNVKSMNDILLVLKRFLNLLEKRVAAGLPAVNPKWSEARKNYLDEVTEHDWQLDQKYIDQADEN
jgi:hypothetical protein